MPPKAQALTPTPGAEGDPARLSQVENNQSRQRKLEQPRPHWPLTDFVRGRPCGIVNPTPSLLAGPWKLLPPKGGASNDWGGSVPQRQSARDPLGMPCHGIHPISLCRSTSFFRDKAELAVPARSDEGSIAMWRRSWYFREESRCFVCVFGTTCLPPRAAATNVLS